MYNNQKTNLIFANFYLQNQHQNAARFNTGGFFTLLLTKGDRQISGRSVVFRPEGVYIYIERAKTAVEKDHKFKEIRRISTLNCLIYGFFRVLRSFLTFIGLFRSYQM